jgi:hypothetical protein
MMKIDDENKRLWEKRYADNFRVAKYPFNTIVSMVLRRFGNEENRALVNILDYGCGGGGQTFVSSLMRVSIHMPVMLHPQQLR